MKIYFAIVENRETMLTEFCKLVTGIAWHKLVGHIAFWDGGRRPIWYMRQEMIKKFLATDCTHLLFVDSDVCPQEGFIESLAKHNLPLVSGVYNDKNGFPINRKQGHQFLGKGLMEVDVWSQGLSLTTREVLEKVPYPDPVSYIVPDSDITFCENVKKAGFKVMQDFTCRAYHLLGGIF